MDETHGTRMAMRIGLLGAECTGKSALARALADALEATVVPEQLREFVAHHGRVPEASDQVQIMTTQQAAEDAAAARGGLLIADPLPLMTAVYSIAYFDDDSLVPEGMRRMSDYDLVIWCRPDIPWEPDGDQRDGPDWRAKVDELLAGTVIPGVREYTTVIEATGPLATRVGAARQAWQRLSTGTPT